MANLLDELGFKSSIADPDVWMRPASRPGSFQRCCEHVLVCVDDAMVLSAVADLVMEALRKTLTFKGGKATDPDIHLGAKIRKRSTEDGEVWTMTSAKHVEAAITTVEEKLANHTCTCMHACHEHCMLRMIQFRLAWERNAHET